MAEHLRASSRDASRELPDGVSEETREASELLAEFQREIGPVDLADFDELQRFLLWPLAHYTRRSMDLDNASRQDIRGTDIRGTKE